MKSLILSLLFSSPLMAVAPTSLMSGTAELAVHMNSTDAEATLAGTNQFSELQTWYNQGADLTWAEIKGSYSGRCYSFNQPTIAKPFVLVYADEGNDDGPGFTKALPVAIDAIAWSDNRSADFYDNISASDIAAAQRSLIEDRSHYSNVTNVPTLSLNYDLENNGRLDFQVRFRKYNGYIIQNITNLIGQTLKLNVMNGEAYAKAGQVIANCYFFKKVGN